MSEKKKEMICSSSDHLMQEQDAYQKTGFALFDYKSPHVWRVPHHRRAIMASLVKGVYRMEKDRVKGLWKDVMHEDIATTSRWWTTFQYERVKLLTEGDVIHGAVYCSLLDHPQLSSTKGHGDRIAQGAPKIVVAMRGTLLSKVDFQADLHILSHRLGAHKGFDMVLQVVREHAALFGPGAVCLAGHSKGASIAMLVGRKLAEEGCYLEAHLFNPPNPSLPFQPLHLPSAVTLKAGVAHVVATNAVARVLQCESTRHHDREAFLAVCNWLPNLYVNARDPLCSSYIEYFEVSKHLPDLKGKWFNAVLSPTPRSLRGVLRSSVGKADSRPDHLIPSAFLYLIDVPCSFQLAHRLDQWLNPGLQITPLQFGP